MFHRIPSHPAAGLHAFFPLLPESGRWFRNALTQSVQPSVLTPELTLHFPPDVSQEYAFLRLQVCLTDAFGPSSNKIGQGTFK